ncbi:MAG: transcriptional repressor [Propionibacterium sp.]|nr:transcriptional repressor [Propionibacterium sp.]
MQPATRNTPQRTAVRDLLAEIAEFRTAQQVHDELRSRDVKIGLATVYRHLTALTEAGELDMLRTPEGETSYRKCSDGHHHHLVCRDCGHTVEISAPVVERWAAELATTHGFHDITHELEVHGLCTDCAAG